MYEAQQLINNLWSNCFEYNDQTPIVFDTYDQARAELNYHLNNLKHDLAEGIIQHFNPNDFRIVEISL